VGHHPEIILAGRRINNEMPEYAAGLLLDEMMRRNMVIANSRVLILGLTFKENTPDIRNTKIVDLVSALTRRGVVCEVCDPWADPAEVSRELGLELVIEPEHDNFDAVVLAVGHAEFVALGEQGVRSFLRGDGVIADFKWVLPRHVADVRL